MRAYGIVSASPFSPRVLGHAATPGPTYTYTHTHTIANVDAIADDKTVCSCSGKTVWQEREEQRDRGML